MRLTALCQTPSTLPFQSVARGIYAFLLFFFRTFPVQSCLQSYLYESRAVEEADTTHGHQEKEGAVHLLCPSSSAA